MKQRRVLAFLVAGVCWVSGCSAVNPSIDPNSVEPPSHALTWTSLTEGFGNSEGTIPLDSETTYAVYARCGGEHGAGFTVDVSYEDGTSIANYQLQCPQEINEPFEVSGNQLVTMKVFPMDKQSTPTYNSYASIVERDN